MCGQDTGPLHPWGRASAGAQVCPPPTPASALVWGVPGQALPSGCPLAAVWVCPTALRWDRRQNLPTPGVAVSETSPARLCLETFTKHGSCHLV